MNPLLLGSIVETVGKIADDLFTSDKERLDAEIRLREVANDTARIEADVTKAQIEVNKEEAKHPSLFVAGARPAILWVGVAAMAYQFILYPLLVWLWFWLTSQGFIPMGMEVPPMLDTEALWVVVTGILGIAGYRTLDKVKGVATTGTAKIKTKISN